MAMESVLGVAGGPPKSRSALRSLPAVALGGLLWTTLAPEPGVAGAPAPRCTFGGQPTIVGTAGNDVLVGTDGRDVIWGGGGHDIIFGRGGNDGICSGAGDDRVGGGPGNDNFWTDKGHDLITDRASGRATGNLESTILPGPGNDTVIIHNDHFVSVQDGGPGNVVFISNGTSADSVSGGAGDDIFRGGRGDDTFEGTTVAGANDFDIGVGGPGDDVCAGVELDRCNEDGADQGDGLLRRPLG